MKFLPFDQDRHNVNILQRVKRLERATEQGNRPQVEEWASFNWDVPAVPSSYAALTPWPVRIGGQCVAVICSAGTAGGGDSTFKVRVDGTQVGSTLTFPASTTRTTLYLGDVRIPAGVNLHFEPVTIGSGLLGFIANVVMKG